MKREIYKEGFNVCLIILIFIYNILIIIKSTYYNNNTSENNSFKEIKKPNNKTQKIKNYIKWASISKDGKLALYDNVWYIHDDETGFFKKIIK